jgi:hypothetical protein
MKRQAWVIFVAAIVLLSVLGCSCGGLSVPIGVPRGSGEAGQDVRDARGVREVELTSLGNLYVELGEREELRIEADENLLRYIETEVRGETLTIRHRRGIGLRPRLPIEYHLTVRALDSVKVSGAGNVSLPELASERFVAEISGAGSIDLEELRAEKLSVRISGAGNFKVQSGEVGDQDVSISGAGDYRAEDLESDTAQVNLSGLGSATLLVREHLDVHITGAGSVRYRGRPTVEKHVTGVGNVEAIGE